MTRLHRVHGFALLVAALLTLSSSPGAQLPSRLSDRATVSLITLSPGHRLHTLFGHGALRVVDPDVGLDASFNYGTFDFGPGFLPKFVYGELDYYLSVSETRYTLEMAREMDRSVTEQVLDLRPDRRGALYEALVLNAQPENRVYRYDFLFDNCSTRLVDILRASLGEGLVLPGGPQPHETFRELLAEHLANRSWLRFGIDLVLGAGVDREATLEESWFLPVRLRDSMDGATLDGHPLVKERRRLGDTEPDGLPAEAFDQPAALAWLLLGLGLVAFARRGRGPLVRFFDGALFAATGLAGWVLLLLWSATLHHVTEDNWNLLWALPTHLLVAFALLRQVRPRWLRVYLVVTALAALVAALGLGLPQDLPSPVLPLGLLLALRSIDVLRDAAPAEVESAS